MRAPKNKKAARTNSTGCLFGTHKRIRTSDPSLRSMAYHVIHGSDVTSNIIPYAE